MAVLISPSTMEAGQLERETFRKTARKAIFRKI